MATSLTEDHKMRTKGFARYCRRELGNDSGYLERMIFPMNAIILCLDQQTSEIAESGEVNARTRCMRRFKAAYHL